MDQLTLLALGVTAFAAGFVDAIGGGGGLLTVPMLALAGLDPLAVLATNKLQSTFGSATATLAYGRAGHVKWASMWPAAVASAAGAAIGVFGVFVVPHGLISNGLPILLVLVALYFGFAPRVGDIDGHVRLQPAIFNLTFVPLIGAYDGAFGPGTGSFFMIGFVALCGFGLLRATAITKLCNFASNVSALVAWVATGHIVWHVGLLMGVAQMLGAQVGARRAMRDGAKLVRPVVIIICLALASRLAWQQWA